MSTPSPLPPLLAANPRLDQWVGFPAPGRVAVSTGRVEIGRGSHHLPPPEEAPG